MLELMCDLLRHWPGLSVGLAITSDEERGGQHGARFLFDELGLRCRIALVPDGGSINDVTVGEKGILHVRLSASGRQSHAARPWLVPNALVRVSRAIVAIHSHFDALDRPGTDAEDHWYPTCSPTICRTANETVNCIPAETYAYLDIRFPPPHTAVDMLDTVRSVAGPDVDVEVVMSAEPTHLAPDREYVRITEQISGRPTRLVRASAGSDARFIARHRIPVILSRPLVGNLHGVDEWIDIESMELFYRIYERFILQRLGHHGDDEVLSHP
jgi:succinyl-diaminopimelate desuccinylase